MSVAVLVKRRLAPLAKTVAPGWFWRRKHRFLQRHGESNPEVQLVRSLCNPDRVSLDIGAAAGEFTIAMLAASRSVIAFEPQPTPARALAAMFDAVGSTVRVEAVAVSDKPGVTKMRVLESDPGRSTIDSDNALNDPDGSRVGTIEVQVRRLDDLQLDDVGFVKVDGARSGQDIGQDAFVSAAPRVSAAPGAAGSRRGASGKTSEAGDCGLVRHRR